MKTLMIIVVAILLFGCATTSLDRMVTGIQNVPVSAWKIGDDNRLYLIDDNTNINISISIKGNLFINMRHIILPWELKLKVQDVYIGIIGRIFCI